MRAGLVEPRCAEAFVPIERLSPVRSRPRLFPGGMPLGLLGLVAMLNSWVCDVSQARADLEWQATTRSMLPPYLWGLPRASLTSYRAFAYRQCPMVTKVM